MAVVDIKIEDLKIHPNNVRKEYDGIDELASSIAEKGIMQNLTVVPDSKEKGKYIVVIGNRRLTAAKQAGIETAPCVIVENMSDKDQVTTMLTENMNRKDLKIYEESGAMQMCLEDFGISVDDIAKETGLSKSTVNHRLNIAKLDQKTLQKKASSEEFQLTLGDLQTLEKIENIKTRNKVLKEASNSRELANRARQAAKEENQAKHEKELVELCKGIGIKKAPKEVEEDFYSGKWDRLANISLDDKVPKKIKYDKEPGERELLYISRYGSFYVVAKAQKEKKELSPWEIQEKERKKTEREVKAKYKVIMEDMADFLRSIFDGKTKPIKDTTEIEDRMWKLLLSGGVCLSKNKIAGLILGKDIYANSVEQSDRDEALSKAEELPSLYQKMACCYDYVSGLSMTDYQLCYLEKNGERLEEMRSILEAYGYSYPDEECKQIADGTHEIYKKQEG